MAWLGTLQTTYDGVYIFVFKENIIKIPQMSPWAMFLISQNSGIFLFPLIGFSVISSLWRKINFPKDDTYCWIQNHISLCSTYTFSLKKKNSKNTDTKFLIVATSSKRIMGDVYCEGFLPLCTIFSTEHLKLLLFKLRPRIFKYKCRNASRPFPVYL